MKEKNIPIRKQNRKNLCRKIQNPFFRSSDSQKFMSHSFIPELIYGLKVTSIIQHALNLLIWMNLFSPPSKQNSIRWCNTIRSLLCGNLVHSVEKSKVEIELALFLSFSLLIASVIAYYSALPRRYLRLRKIYIYHCKIQFVYK